MSFSVRHLSVSIGDKHILRDVSFTISAGSLHALMGPNGSGKSTCASSLMGHPSCQTDSSSSILLEKTELVDKSPDERARLGLFLAFQNPVAVPGVTVSNLLRSAYATLHAPRTTHAARLANPLFPPSSFREFHALLMEKAKLLSLPTEFLKRSLNEEFSGGEKKKLEMLQALVLAPKYAIFDEIDTGLDVDALKLVARGILELQRQGTGVVVITHYQRILRYTPPDFVHILVSGCLVKSGTRALARQIEKSGYSQWSAV